MELTRRRSWVAKKRTVHDKERRESRRGRSLERVHLWGGKGRSKVMHNAVKLQVACAMDMTGRKKKTDG